MGEGVVTGWDVGGAHLKVVQLVGAGQVRVALQLPCPLWQGMERLDAALAAARPKLLGSDRHAITMTGELVDLFVDRAEGVGRLAATMAAALQPAWLGIYAGDLGFVPPEQAAGRAEAVASANWHASVRFAAARCGDGVLVDIGSTTSDIVPFAGGRVAAAGYTDAERLACEELVYTGVTRTPVMAIAAEVPFAGQRQRLMAEYFATAADLHRLIGRLPEDADQHPTADGRGRSEEESARRLARMLGRDAGEAPLAVWRRLAALLVERQRRLLEDALDRTVSRGLLGPEAPLVGAGVGRYLARDLAARQHRPYRDFAELVEGTPGLRDRAASYAPAAAVAALLAVP
jgi:probable H4MPT-linked C1 transfer pathway protein